MAEPTLGQRIKSEFDSRAQRVRQSEEAQAKEAQVREQRMARFNAVCEVLHPLVQSRLQEFAAAFGEEVRITPTITPAERSATVVFMTDLASVTLTMRMAPDPDVTKLVLEYDLLIIPMFFEYDRHARLEMPLEHVDREAVAKWLDDRIVSCVQSYLAIPENEYYVRRATVEDPISKERFAREQAAGMIEHNGQKLYFKTAETLKQFRALHEMKG